MCNLHWCYTFCTGVTLFALVLHLNCTALSQSESSNFFMCIIKNDTESYVQGYTTRRNRSTHKLPVSRVSFFDNTFTTSKRGNVVNEGTQNYHWYTIKSENYCGALQCNAPYRGHPTNFHISQLHVNMSTQQPMQRCSTYNCANIARRRDCQ